MFSALTTKIIIFTLQPKIPSRTNSVQTVNAAKSPITVLDGKWGFCGAWERQGQKLGHSLSLPVASSTGSVRKKHSADNLGRNLLQPHPFIYLIKEAQRRKGVTEIWNQNSDKTRRTLLSLSGRVASTISVWGWGAGATCCRRR